MKLVSCWLFTNVSSRAGAVPIIPVIRSIAKDVLIPQEGHTVLASPVIGFISHPVKPDNIDKKIFQFLTIQVYHWTSVWGWSQVQLPQLCSLWAP